MCSVASAPPPSTHLHIQTVISIRYPNPSRLVPPILPILAPPDVRVYPSGRISREPVTRTTVVLLSRPNKSQYTLLVQLVLRRAEEIRWRKRVGMIGEARIKTVS